MAKIKTAKELKQEADKFLSDAKKQHAVLLKKAQELEDKKLVELGQSCIQFLKGEITQSELMNFATELELIENSDETKEEEISKSKPKKENKDLQEDVLS